MTIEPLLKAIEKMSTNFLAAVFDTLPVQFSVIDADDNVLFWNLHGIRIFKRGPAVIGRNVRMCHPKASLNKIEKVLEYLKSGERDRIEFWMDLPDGDEERSFLGLSYWAKTVELVAISRAMRAKRFNIL